MSVNDEGRVDDERTVFRGESTAVYCFDFQDFPEATAGQVMSAPVVVVSSGNAALLVLGTPFVLTAVFQQLDRRGNVEDSVPAGAGVKVAFTPPAVVGIKGECIVTCLVNFNGGPPAGSTRAKRCKFIVK